MISDFPVTFQHLIDDNVQAMQMLQYGANRNTIQSLLGSMPRIAEQERKRRTDAPKTRNGANCNFFENDNRAWRLCNMLWQRYALLTKDLYIRKPLDYRAMLTVYGYIHRIESDLMQWVDFNRFFNFLCSIAEESIMIAKCSQCGTYFLAKRDRIQSRCNICFDLRRFEHDY